MKLFISPINFHQPFQNQHFFFWVDTRGQLAGGGNYRQDLEYLMENQQSTSNSSIRNSSLPRRAPSGTYLCA